MPTWNSDHYLTFSEERTRPAVDLVARVAIDAPDRVADLGCGPGNNTAVLVGRWPNAALTGIDNSAAMLDAARRDHPSCTWVEADISSWSTATRFAVVFSNAALQWVPDHAALLPRLLDQVRPGGALAVQVPANLDALPHRLMRELSAAPAWQDLFPTPPRVWHVHPVEFYYDVLAGRARRLDIWITEYLHVLDDVDAIVEWYRGTGLRPWLEALHDEEARRRFVADYRALLAPRFEPRKDGNVLFPFRRLFVVAYR